MTVSKDDELTILANFFDNFRLVAAKLNGVEGQELDALKSSYLFFGVDPIVRRRCQQSRAEGQGVGLFGSNETTNRPGTP